MFSEISQSNTMPLHTLTSTANIWSESTKYLVLITEKKNAI